MITAAETSAAAVMPRENPGLAISHRPEDTLALAYVGSGDRDGPLPPALRGTISQVSVGGAEFASADYDAAARSSLAAIDPGVNDGQMVATANASVPTDWRFPEPTMMEDDFGYDFDDLAEVLTDDPLWSSVILDNDLMIRLVVQRQPLRHSDWNG